MKYLAFVALLTACLNLHASELGEPLTNASDQYLKSGADKFMSTVLEGSTYTNDPSYLARANSLRQMEDLFGKFLGVELVKVVPISKSTRIVYFTMKYQKSPAYGAIIYYMLPSGKESTAQMQFSINPWEVFPQNFFG